MDTSAKRRAIHNAPFWGVDMPAELFGLLCWLVAGFLGDSPDRKSLKETCKAAFVGFRLNATEVTLRSIANNEQTSPCFFCEGHSFPRVKHITFQLRATNRYGKPFPAWDRNTFPVASTMRIHVTLHPRDRVQDSDMGGIWGYPLGVTSYEGTVADLGKIAICFQRLSHTIAHTPVKKWDMLERVTLVGFGGASAFDFHAMEVLQHHRLDCVTLYRPMQYLNDIMVCPPKQLVVDPIVLGLVARHSKFDKLGSVALACLYSKSERHDLAGYALHRTDDKTLVPKLDAMSVAKLDYCLPFFSAPNCPSRVAMASLIAHVNNAQYGTLAKHPCTGALDCDVDFMVQALRGICTPGRGVFVVVRVLRTFANLGGPERVSNNLLTAIARSVFASAQVAKWPEDVEDFFFGAGEEFGLWREYFLNTRFCVTEPGITGLCMGSAERFVEAAPVFHHIRVTLAENYLRGDESPVVVSSLRYLYRTVHADDGTTDAVAKATLASRREYIEGVRKSLKLALHAADYSMLRNVIRICEERLAIAESQCTGPLGQVLLGTDDIKLR